MKQEKSGYINGMSFKKYIQPDNNINVLKIREIGIEVLNSPKYQSTKECWTPQRTKYLYKHNVR